MYLKSSVAIIAFKCFMCASTIKHVKTPENVVKPKITPPKRRRSINDRDIDELKQSMDDGSFWEKYVG